MTTHYTVDIIKSEMTLKATYRNHRLLRIEYLSGRFDELVIKYLGSIIPANEREIDHFKANYKGKITYTPSVKKKSIYTLFVDTWYEFYESYAQMSPKFTGADGKAVKQIIKYLTGVSGTEQKALELWQLILGNWDHLPEFHKNNTDLKYINSKLNVILHAIKRQNNTYASGTDSSVEL